MADQPARSTRRQAIKQTALAAGLVWTAPAIQSVRLGATVGTPVPPTSGTTPTVTTYTFDGQFSQRPTVPQPQDPGCDSTLVLEYEASVEGIGTGTVTQRICQANPEGEDVVSLLGDFLLTTADGSFQGTARGSYEFGRPFYNLSQVITIVAGTDVFAGATGEATIDGFIDPNGFIWSGVLTGSVDVPS